MATPTLDTVLLHTAGHAAVDIAALLGIHVNTVYADLRLFHRRRLAEQPPTELGLPYGRCSLTKLRDYLLSHRMVRRISREHLRRLLKKGGLVPPHRPEAVVQGR